MEKTFAYHKPTENALARIRYIRDSFSETLRIIKTKCPNSREKSIAITELETSCMWAIKAVVCNDPESVVEE